MGRAALGWSSRRGRIHLDLACIRMGSDLCVTLSGGDREHIGAVALSQPHPSLEDPSRTSASTSILTLQGHKEDDLARAMAARLASSLGVTVCVACGIHVDSIQGQELEDVNEMAQELCGSLISLLEESVPGSRPPDLLQEKHLSRR